MQSPADRYESDTQYKAIPTGWKPCFIRLSSLLRSGDFRWIGVSYGKEG